MKVLVLGAGVIGTTTAWYLTQQGHEVTVVDRRDGAGLETSFANGGQISACHPEPWSGPQAPLKILKWLWRDDSPLLFRLRMDPHQWSWGLKFLFECLPSRMQRNVADIARISVYSRACLQQLRADTSIHYDELKRGIMHFYTDREDFEGAAASAPLLREYGIEREVKTVDEAVAIEPALASARERIAGVTYMAGDESGDAYLFTQRLAALAETKGCRFVYGKSIEAIDVAGGEVSGVRAGGAVMKADAYVVALGSYSPMITRPIGFDLPVYPAKGYSATVPIRDASKAPKVSLTDEGAKIVMTRLGDRLRIAGTAELSGYSTQLNMVRCEALTKRAALMFPDAGDYAKATFWTGLRPSTPSNVPIIGRSRYRNLFLNTGHGTLGWTMGAGSGRALADIISGRKPEVEFRFAGTTP
ncbi:MAG TPA: D-amino acid dehydrogenase [Usitatibacter sp.]|nr:D-amino acid dehydrogenase [Usitatibacter sp.]